jgi:hypothetical protein
MAEKIYLLQNSAAPTTAAPVKQPTGTAIRTMLQLQMPSTESLTIIEWGISFDGVTATSVPIQVELLGTTVAATMSTATVAADIVKLNQPLGVPSLITIGATTNTGFATAAVTEGTVANARILDLQQVPPTGGYVKQFPLGREPMAEASTYVRIRVTAGVTVNAYCYIVWSE